MKKKSTVKTGTTTNTEAVEDAFFEQAKTKLLMRLRGISREEAQGIIGARRATAAARTRKYDVDDDDGFLSAEEFFGVK